MASSWQMAARSALVWSHSRPWATLCTLGDWRLSKGERGECCREGNDWRWQQWQFNVFLLSTLRIEDRGSRGETNTYANIDHSPAGALSLSVVWLSVVLSRTLFPLGSRRLISYRFRSSSFTTGQCSHRGLLQSQSKTPLQIRCRRVLL